MLCCAVLCCAVLCCLVLCCVVLSCLVLSCLVSCCVVLCLGLMFGRFGGVLGRLLVILGGSWVDFVVSNLV